MSTAHTYELRQPLRPNPYLAGGKAQGRTHRRNNRTTDTDEPAIQRPTLATVRPIPRGRLTTGTLCWARIEFEDGTGDKVRPVVVVATTSHDVTVLPSTTSLRQARREPHVPITHLDHAGLPRTTWIRLRPTVIERRFVNSEAGHLHHEDYDRVFNGNAAA